MQEVGGGGLALMHVYVLEHIVSLYYDCDRLMDVYATW